MWGDGLAVIEDVAGIPAGFDVRELRDWHGRWADTPDSPLLKRFRKAKTGNSAFKSVQSTKDLSKADPLVGASSLWYQLHGMRINQGFRRRETDLDGKDRVAVATLDRAMAPTADDMVTYRVIRFPQNIFGNAWNEHGSNEGLTWQDPALVSTSTSPEFMQTWGEKILAPGARPSDHNLVIMKMLVPKGTPALRADFGNFDEGMKEIMLGRKNGYRIVHDSGSRPGGKAREITVEVIPHPASRLSAATAAGPAATLAFAAKPSMPAPLDRLVDTGPLVKIIKRVLRKRPAGAAAPPG